MKPLSLSLKAFGPYLDETINFSPFYENNIFLIAGKTGSGKTTIFDAISFALFGKNNGSNREPKEMRSTFADSSIETSIVFTFSANQKLYEISRKPAQKLPKQKGDGMKEVPAKASIRIMDEFGKELDHYSKISEVDDIIENTIQLNNDQFRQIVMIPQGEFRRFLNASSSEKESILRKLFNTTIYQSFSEYLKAKQKDNDIQLHEKKQKMKNLIQQAEWLNPFESIEESGQAKVIIQLEQLKRQQVKMVDLGKKLKVELSISTEQKKYAEKALEEQKKAAQLRKEQQTLVERRNKLLQEESFINEQKSKATAIRKAKEILPDYEQLNQKKETLKESKEYYNRIQEEKTKYTHELESFFETISAMQKKMPIQEERKKQLETLKQLKEKIERFQQLKKEVSNKEHAVEKNKKIVSDLKTKQQEMIERKKRKQEYLNNYLIEEKEYYEKKEIKTELNQTKQRLMELAKIETQRKETIKHIEQLSSQFAEEQKEAKLIRNQLKIAKSDWAKVQIKRLAESLIVGEPCLVCGSIDHPSPCGFKGEAISLSPSEVERNLDLAEKNEKRSIEKLEELKTNIRIQKEAVVKLTAELTEKSKLNKERLFAIDQKQLISEQLTTVEKKVKAIQLFLKEFEDKKVKIQEIKEDLREFQEAEVDIAKDITIQEETIQAEFNSLSKSSGALEQVKTHIPNSYLDEKIYAKEIEFLQTEIKHWEKKHQEMLKESTAKEKQLYKITNEQEFVEDSLKKIEEQYKFYKSRFYEKIHLSPFKNEDSFLKMVNEKDTLKKIEEKLQEYEKNYFVVVERLQDIEKVLNCSDEPEVAKAEAEVERIDEDRTQLVQKKALHQKSTEHNSKIIKQMQQIMKLYKQQEAEYIELASLSAVANGDSSQSKMGLERYVLASFLEEVLVIANERLQKLTSNRYLFDLNREEGSYKKNTGLEINVYDDHAGGIRSVGTLSGGESFIAALSLALSLSEVVQQYSGGTRIDAVFIDEGFGSLDEDALEQAIDALMQIDGEGRLFGIISHVKELKDRIPDKVIVSSSGTGISSLSVQHS